MLHFWDEPQRGANSFNRTPPDAAYFEALARTGASWVRLTFSKWDGLGPDFLLGDADRYTGLPATDFAILVEVANPRNLAAWQGPLRDERVLYAFHMYEPYAATSAPNMKRKEPLRYPGTIAEYAGEPLRWDAAAVKEHIATAFRWAASHDLPPTRVVGSEFGCMRRWADCGAYLEDVIDAVESFGGHWAFYAFREDEWDGMDYELRADFPPGRFYWLMQSGQFARIPRDGELIERLLRRMRSL